MAILDQRPDRRRAVPPARADDRELARERDLALRDRGLAAEALEGPGDVGRALQPQLALAVVTQPPRLEHQRQPELVRGAHDVLVRRNAAPRRHRDAQGLEQPLFREPVLRFRERGHGRTDRYPCRHPPGGGHRHVLELVGHDVGKPRERLQRLRVVEWRTDDLAHGGGGRIDGWIEEHELDPQRPPGFPEHEPELAGPDHADGRHRCGAPVPPRRRMVGDLRLAGRLPRGRRPFGDAGKPPVPRRSARPSSRGSRPRGARR